MLVLQLARCLHVAWCLVLVGVEGTFWTCLFCWSDKCGTVVWELWQLISPYLDNSKYWLEYILGHYMLLYPAAMQEYMQPSLILLWNVCMSANTTCSEGTNTHILLYSQIINQCKHCCCCSWPFANPYRNFCCFPGVFILWTKINFSEIGT